MSEENLPSTETTETIDLTEFFEEGDTTNGNQDNDIGTNNPDTLKDEVGTAQINIDANELDNSNVDIGEYISDADKDKIQTAKVNIAKLSGAKLNSDKLALCQTQTPNPKQANTD